MSVTSTKLKSQVTLMRKMRKPNVRKNFRQGAVHPSIKTMKALSKRGAIEVRSGLCRQYPFKWFMAYDLSSSDGITRMIKCLDLFQWRNLSLVEGYVGQTKHNVQVRFLQYLPSVLQERDSGLHYARIGNYLACNHLVTSSRVESFRLEAEKIWRDLHLKFEHMSQQYSATVRCSLICSVPVTP